MKDFNLEGRTAVITGASRGIGLAIARKLAQYGAQCILVSRKLENLETAAAGIRELGFKAEAMACHTGHPEQIKALYEQIVAKYGTLDILINNAATNPFYGPAAKLPPDAFDKTVDVNLKGPYYMMSHAVPLMAESGGGSIVNVASVAALVSMSGQAVYAMTKAGLV